MTQKMQHWNNMYALPEDEIPWEISEPPVELSKLVESGSLLGKTALDVACGTGNYSAYLARHGFAVTGVDFAQNALDIAAERSAVLQLDITFLHADVTQLFNALASSTFDFILDYSTLHHIAPDDVAAYARQFKPLLNPGGKLLTICYSERDEYSHGDTKATGKYGNDMFYRSRAEIEKLYTGLDELSYEEARLGKRSQHSAHAFLFGKGK